ncbi:Ig-like domain repeat protein [Paracidovorax konjaci]|uniref:YD repeat-containing protein n=1 Tax=Paracidovorax konjaci TaxID=32040 RepID=A0A1I1WE58_9BURK|nr:Ig-like domain repeat protein [Paracidovorax konjaci]SFD93269.1 YD repeat-containing protein [Paracidovorax konjaci]
MVAIVSGNNLGLSTSSFATLGQGGVFGSATQGRGGEQAYVNLATGNLVLQRRDDFVASQGQGMDVLRTYNSRGLLDDDNADNWSIGIYNQPLRLTGTRNTAGSVLSRTARDGARSDYRFDTTQGLYVGTDGVGAYDTLRWDEAGGQYVWTDGDSGEQERYEGSGDHRLVSRSDAHGSITRYQYGADGLLASVTDASGETTHYDYTGRNLAQIRVVAQDGSTSTRLRYAYDASNRLATVTVDLSPGDNSTADGKVYQTTYTYDGDSRRVASVSQTDGTRLEIGYALIDGDYRVASVKDALGLTTRYAYDTTARTTTVTDPLNVASRYAYDDRGQLLRVQTGITEARPAGLSQLYYRYDSQGNVTAMTDALGRSIALQYDAHGNQTVKVDPLGNTLVRTYDERNQLLTETLRAGDGNGSAASAPTFGGSNSTDSTTRYVYSAQERGQLRFVLSAEGRVTEYRYDALGQRVTALAYAAAAYGISGLGSSDVPTEAQMANWAAGQDLRGGQRTDTRYDFRGQVAYSTAYGTLDAAGEGSDPAVTQYVYSQAGELLKTVQPRTDSITQYVYDGLGRVIVASAPSSDGTTANTTVTEYGAASTTVTLVNGLSTVSNYDAAGRLTSVLQGSAGTTLGITRYAYDAAGRLLMTQDPTGVRQWLLYDDAGRKVADVDGTGAATEYRYNGNGQLAQTIAYARTLASDLNTAPTLEAIHALAAADDRKSWQLYDSAQRLAWQVDSAGAVTQTEYDAASRVVAVTRLATPIDTQLLGDGSALTVGPAGLASVANGQKAATGIAVRASAAAVAAGAMLTLEASVAGSQPVGMVTFYSGSTALGSAQIVDGVARLALNTLAVGTHAINARYEGDATHAAATSTAVAATVLQAAAVGLDPLPGTVALGRSQVLRATVSGGAPGGTVTFFDGSAVIGSGVLQNVAGVPTATVVWNVQTPGSHAISAVYSGDAANASAATSSAVTLRAGLASEIVLESGSAPSTVNMALTLRARVSVPGSQTQPTGSIAFYRGTELLATAALDAQGLAIFSTSSLTVGLHSLTAVYLGDDAIAGSRSATFAQTVLPAASTTTVLATSHVQIAAGAALALTVRVAAVADPATALGGTVTFYDGDTRLGSAALVNGQASFNATGVTAGSHGYRAVYSGDAADAASTSAIATVVSVANGPSIATPVARSTGLVLAVSSTAIAKGNAVNVTATVTGNHPTGTVTFVSGGRVLGSAALVDGQAVLSFTPSEAGDLSVQALYAGDAGNPATASGEPARIAVAPAAARMVLSVSSTQAVRGAGVVLTATLSGSDTAVPPTGSVTFYANGTAIGTAMLSQGLASLAIATLDIGSNAITVQYTGDARNAGVTSAAQDLRIISAPASVALGASAQQAAAGASVTFTATVVPAASGASPTGRVDFFNGTSFLGSASLANGVATLTTNGLRNVGVANVTAVYTGDASGAVSRPFSLSISSGVELSVSSPRIVSGNPVVLSANVGSGTGTVSFFDGSVYLGSASASSGVASLTTKALTQAGSHAITAVYAGDANRAGAASAALAVQVSDAVELAASGSTVIAGAPLVLTASVNSATSAIVNGVAVPAGAIANGVTLIDGTVTKTSGASDWESSIRSTVGVSGGAGVSFKAGQTNKAIMVGLNTDPGTNDNYLTIDWAIYITYDGAMYAYQNGASVASLGTYTTGDVLSVEYLNGVVSYRKNGTVLRQESANITQPLYLDTSFYGTGGAITGLKFKNGSGQEVPLNAAAAPTGTVTFFNGREVLGTASVVNGVARLTTSALAAQGTAQITAVYGGDANNPAATSAARAVAVNDAIGLGASATSVAAGDAVTLTARMNAQPSVVATGVSFEGGAVKKTGTASQWDASVRSVVGYAGGASVRFTVGGQSDQNYVIGLNTDPASDNGLASLDWAIHVSGSTVELYRDGVLVANVGTIVAGDVLALGYDAGAVSYAKNGVVLRRETAQIGQPLYLDSSFYAPGSAVSGLEFRDGAGTLVALSAKPAATGRVTFHSGGAVLGTATLVDGVASLTTRGLTTAGMASITATYEGDANNAAGFSSPMVLPVGAAPGGLPSTTTALAVSSASTSRGQEVALTATVTGGASGFVTFFSGTQALGVAALVNGVATWTTKDLPVGAHAWRAVYTGDAQSASSTSSAVSGAVTAAGSGLTLAATVASRSASEVTVTLAARVAGLRPGGTVTFYNNDAPIGGGTVGVVDGVATLSVTLPAGAVRITARYTGDANNAAAASEPLALSLRGGSTVVVAAPSPASAVYGSPVTLSATAPYSSANAGTVSFYAGDLLVGVATVQPNGVATLVSTAMPVGTRTITAAYSGNAEREPASQSAAAPLVVTGMATQTVLTASHSQRAPGTPLVLDATTTSGGRAAGISGAVRFYAGSTLLGTVQATDGVARFTLTDVPANAGTFTAVYSGFQGFDTSTSQTEASAALAAGTSITLETSAPSVSSNAAVTLSARVTGRQPGGNVTFLRAGAVLGTAAVVNGVASLVVTGMPLGTHELSARYDGDAFNSASGSIVLAQTVTAAAGVSLSLASSDTLEQGGAVSFAVGGMADGIVTLVDGNTALSTARVVNGIATLSTRDLAVGSHQLTVSYGANASSPAALLAFRLTITPGQAPTAVALGAATNRTEQGLSTLLSAQVSGGQPGGRVTFYNGDTALGTVDLVYGLAVLATDAPPSALDRFRAVYLGDTGHAGSASAVLAGHALEGEALSPLTRSTLDRTLAQIHSRDGLLLGTVDGEGYLTEYRYDAAARMIGSVRYALPVAGGATAAAAVRSNSLSSLRPTARAGDAHTAYFYDVQGRRIGELDAEGNLTQTSYDANGNVAAVRRYANAVTAITAAQVTAATRLTDILPAASAQDQVTTRSYDALNRLSASVNAEGTTTQYRYDSMGRLAQTVQAAGASETRAITARYDAQGRLTGELTAQGAALLAASAGGAQTEAIWQQYGLRHTYDAAGRRSSTTDPNGQQTLFFYDAAGRLTHTVNPMGEVTETRYNAFGEVASSTRRANRADRLALANAGGLSGGLASAGVLAALAQAQSATADTTVSYRYSTTGTLAQSIDAQGFARNYVYNTFGEEVRLTAAAGTGTAQTVATAYDRRGLAVQRIQDPDALRLTSTITYDAFGRAIATSDALGQVRTQTYDRVGRLIATTDALGRTTGTTAYDAFGRTATQTDGLGHTTTYTYSLEDRSVTVTTPEGIRVSTVHDRLGQTVSVQDGSGAVTRYEYDANGRQTAVQTALTRTASSYDAGGRLVETTDANGVKTALAYDAAGRVLTRTVDPSGLNLITRYSYDAQGNQLSVTDAQGVVTQFGYDNKGQLIRQVVDPAGLALSTTYAYDGLGHAVSVTAPDGTTTAYQYDTLGRRVLEVVDPSTATHAGLNLAKRYSYDAAGNVTSVTDAQGHVTRYAYDKEGRQRFVLDAAGNLAETAYDAAGRVVRQTRYAQALAGVDGLPLAVGEGQLDGLKTVQPAKDQTEHRVYDADNRVTATVNGAGDVVHFDYDGAGRVVGRRAHAQRLDMAQWVVGTDPNPGTDPTNSPDGVTRTVYDALGRVRYSIDGTGAVVSQRYDSNGNVTQRIRYTKRLDLTGQPLSARPSEAELAQRVEGTGGAPALYDAQRDEQTRMRYDAAGRLALMADGAGGVTQYLYDKNGRLLQSTRYATPIGDTGMQNGPITVPQASLSDAFVRKVYDAAGRLTVEVDASGAVTTYGYDAAGRLLRETRLAIPADAYRRAQAGGALLAEPTSVASSGDRTVRHFLDRAGRETLTIDAEGGATERFYDGTGQLLRVRQSATALTGSQIADLESQRAQAGELSRSAIAQTLPANAADRTTRNYYDAAGRLRFTRDALGQLQGYVYDGVGRLTDRTTYMGTQGADAWIEEGITGYMKTAGGEGRKPLYRLSRTSGPGDHLYTSDPAERDWALQNGWQAEGDVGYLQSAPSAGTAPLYRLRPPGTSTNHFYTASEDLRAYAKNVLGWTEEGIMGYIDVAPGKDNGALYQLNANGTNEHFHSRGRAEIDLALMPNPTATAGADRTESLRYDAAGNLIASTDAAGKQETTEYDGTGRKERFTNKAGSTWTYAYNAAGQLTQETSPQVKLFDGQNEVLASVVTRMDYDALGHLTARTEAAGLPEARTTRYEYDALGRQVKTIFPPVAVYQGESAAALLDNGRNAAGTRTDTTIAEISSETRYDTLGNAVAGRAAGSTAWSYKAYDRANHVAWDIDALGYVTGYTRNAFGEAERLVRYAQNIATRADGVLMREDEVRQAVAARASSADRDILTGYDRLGRAQEVQEPYVFSVNGSTAEQGAGRKTTRNSYDALGNLVTVATNVGNALWATTRYGYDALGRRVGTTDAMGYATSDTYDAAGNVVRHVEYARAGTAPGSTPETAAGDRVTDTAYDLLNRKTTETRRGVGYTATNASASGIESVLQSRTGDLATQYAYDALGNLVRTTDALGGTTYQYYDVLGRVRASITPAINLGVAANGQGRAPVAPLTEYRRDAHGNAVATTQYAGGATVSADGSDYTRSASASDRTSYARFDAQGHTLETVDAQGNSHYYAYDAQGRLAKEWQKVTYVDDAGARQVHSLWRAYAYDTLGRQTHTYAPLQKNTDPGQLSLGDTELTYNAFGEVTRKRVLDGGQALQGDEVYDYDNAGRVWRSNAGDGVMKVMAYDLQGRQTVQLVASGMLKLEDFGDALAALGAQANAPEQFRRTDMRYDLLGRLVQTLAPERASERAMAITTRQNLVYAVMTQSEVNDNRVDKSSNQVDLVWRSLQDLGSGDVRITLQYLSAKYVNENQDNPDGNPAKSVTRNIVVSAEEAATGYSFKWQSPLSGESGIAKGISAIQGIKVEKLDIFGNWATLYDVAQPKATTGQLPWSEAASPGYIWNESGEGRKPIYRYYNGSNDTHLFSANPADRDALLNQRMGWLDEGIAGYVASAPADGLTALYRLGKAGTDISVYTSSTQRRSELLASGWEDRGIDGYVGSPGADAAAMAQKGMTLMHALQHHRSANGDAEWKDGLYTTSVSERNALLQGLPPSQQQQQAQSQSQGSSGASWGGSVSQTGNASSGSATTGGIGRTTVLYGAITAQSLEVSLPQDVVSSLRIETRPAGGTQWEARTLGSAALRTFGSAHRIDVGQLGLAPGGYEYRITNVQGGEVREVGSGTFALGANGAPDADNAPRLQGVAPARASIDGTSYQVLQWPQPAQDQSVVFRWRPQDSAAWTGSRTVGNGLYAYGDGRTSGFGVGMQGTALDMAAGSYEYEIVVTNAAGGTAQRAKGVMVIPQNAALANTTPAIVMANNNVTNLGLVGYLWSEPAPDRKPLVRYYFPYQGNSHHLSTADAGVIANLDDRIARDAAAGSPPAIVREGILGYVQISPTGSNQRLYQYKYGNDVVYRLTANPADVGSYQPIYADPQNDSNFHFAPNTWYQNAYQNDGFISSVPVEGTTALYAVYNGNAQGTLSLGDYFTSPSEYEVISSFMLRAATAATQTLAGVGMGRAVIDGSDHAVLQWPQQEAGARVKITASPGIPGGTPAPYLFRQGSAALQGIVLDGLNPGATYTIRIEVEHPASGGRSAYLARTDVTITVPAAGMNAAVAVTDKTPAYLPPLRAQTAAAAAQGDMSGRPVTAREFDRWGNVTAIDETQGLGEGKRVRTAELRYDANNQVVEQRRLHEDANFAQSWASTRIYYDALGRQVGLRDANGNLNAQVRDLAGNVVQERHADGGRLDNAFNAFGDKVSSAELVDADSGRTTVTGYDYDRMSRLTKTTLVQGEALRNGVVGITGNPVQLTSNVHPSNGMAMAEQVAMRELERAEYDEAGRKVCAP